jgi:hypothetical protein
MRAILIDPTAILTSVKGQSVLSPRTPVSEVEYDGQLRSIYSVLSYQDVKVDMFEVVSHPSFPDNLYVDEEGLMKDPQFWFGFYRYPQPLAGRGLYVGCDGAGEDCAPRLPLAEVEQHVICGWKNIEWNAAEGYIAHDRHVLDVWGDRYPWLGLQRSAKTSTKH